MKLLITHVLLTCLICFHAKFGSASGLEKLDFNSEDTVVIEAVDSDSEEPSLGKRGARQEAGSSCVTNSGLPGQCESIRSCFPRLFPIDSSYDDTPKSNGGVYNQNLAQFLVEAAGFCGSEVARDVPIDFKNLRIADTICCASTKVNPNDFPIENSTAEIDSEFVRQPCGHIKVDPETLPPAVEKIVGGKPAALGEYPWMVGMVKRGQQFCGASLLDSKNVITAAHCVDYMTSKDVAALRLHIGDLKIYDPNETNHVERKAKRVLFHKGFSMKNVEHDVALIHLDKPVEFSKTVQPICLHPGNPAYDTGNVVADVTGWGTTSSGGNLSPSLLAVTVPVITTQSCNAKYAKANKKIGQGMVCAGKEGKDSCQGDSGGPLVMDPRGQAKQIGIVSWGIGCATYPGVYTRVDKYMKWINKNKS